MSTPYVSAQTDSVKVSTSQTAPNHAADIETATAAATAAATASVVRTEDRARADSATAKTARAAAAATTTTPETHLRPDRVSFAHSTSSTETRRGVVDPVARCTRSTWQKVRPATEPDRQ